jgi:hypothetical protein
MELILFSPDWNYLSNVSSDPDETIGQEWQALLRVFIISRHGAPLRALNRNHDDFE